MTKLHADDTLQDVILKLVENNPGAIRVLFELIKHHPDGDKVIRKFDDLEIYGSQIWLCYKDLLNYDIGKLFNMLRTGTLKQAIEEARSTNPDFRLVWDYHMKEMNKQ